MSILPMDADKLGMSIMLKSQKSTTHSSTLAAPGGDIIDGPPRIQTVIHIQNLCFIIILIQ